MPDKLEHKQFSLVFLDIRMPILDGLETLAEINRMGLYPKPRVIALTANVIYGDARNYHQAGFTDCLTKPVSRQQIRAVIQPCGEPETKSGLNWQRSLSIAGGDAELARELLAKLVSVLPELNKHLASAEASKALDADYLHQILGLVSYTGAETLKKLLIQLENRLRKQPCETNVDLISDIIIEVNLVAAQSLRFVDLEREQQPKLA